MSTISSRSSVSMESVSSFSQEPSNLSPKSRRKWENLTNIRMKNSFISGDLLTVRSKARLIDRIIVFLFAYYYRSEKVAESIKNIIYECSPEMAILDKIDEIKTMDDFTNRGSPADTAMENINYMRNHIIPKKKAKESDLAENMEKSLDAAIDDISNAQFDAEEKPLNKILSLLF